MRPKVLGSLFPIAVVAYPQAWGYWVVHPKDLGTPIRLVSLLYPQPWG